MSNNKLELANWASSFALKNGASQVKVNVSRQHEVNIEIRDKKTDKLLESTSNSLGIDIYVDNKYSGQSTNDLRKPELEKFILDAIAATKYLAKDEFRMLPDPKYYKKLAVDLNVNDQNYATIDPAGKIKIAETIEGAALSQSDKIISVTAYFSDGKYESATVQSNGFEGQDESTFYSIGASVSVKDPNGSRPEDWKGVNSRFYKTLPTPEAIGIEAAQNTLKRIGQKKVASGKYDLIIQNEVAGRAVGMLINPMNGSSIHQKRSFLDKKLGEKLFSDKLTITDNPLLIGGLGSQLYDGDGIASQKRTMIENGVLKNYYIDYYYGKKLNMEPTTGYATNLLLTIGNTSLLELIKKTEKGILVNGFNGGNSNSTTGDFSYGVQGMLIENGQLTQPVNEMIVSGNALTFWSALADLGNDPYPYSSWQSPSMLFKDIDFGGL